MRIAYLDCFAGISGDMLLGALVDAGVPRSVLEDAAAAMQLGVHLSFETVDRSGISATKVHVLEDDRLAEAPVAPSEPEHSHVHPHEPAREHAPESHPEASGETAASPDPLPIEPAAAQARHQERPQPFSPFDFQRDHPRNQEPEPLSAQPQTQHMHRQPDGQAHVHVHEETHAQDHTHEAGHEHAHPHGRSLTVIRRMISDAALDEPVKQLAIRAFELLGESEARIHNVPVDEIHFHEVGAVDAIVDIVANAAGLLHLGVEQWFCSPLNVGGGMVQCAHGNFPVPAPATADLLRGVPIYSADIDMELVTPTGAALLRALAPTFERPPAMRVEHIGYGAGTRDPECFPNVLRLQIGQMGDVAEAGECGHAQTPVGLAHEDISVLETAIDDLSPQLLANVAEKALAEGALDVMLTPVIMKKGRPGTLVTVLAKPADSPRFAQMLLRETSTLGVRIRQESRACLEREHVAVATAFGEIRVKIGRLAGEELNATPEFEDCRAAAQQHGVPVKQVQQAAMAVYHNSPVV